MKKLLAPFLFSCLAFPALVLADSLPTTSPIIYKSTFSLIAAAGGLTLDIATGGVTNAMLANASMTVGGVTCTLGGSCSPAGTTYSAGVGLGLAGTVFSVNACNATPFIAYRDCNQNWFSQRGVRTSPTISTATFTPNFDTAQNYIINLTSACPCTLANPSTTVVEGQSGMITVIQDGTGSRTIGTYGSKYKYVGGTSTITLASGANQRTYMSYYTDDSLDIILFSPASNPTH